MAGPGYPPAGTAPMPVAGQARRYVGRHRRESFIRPAKLRLTTLPTWLNFAVGGGAIGIVGSVLLWALVHAGVPARQAMAVQLVVTLIMNFVYNARVTWRNRDKTGLAQQIAWFAVTRGATQTASYFAFAWLLSHRVGYAPGYAICLAGATVVNFVTSDKLVFRAKPGLRTAPIPQQACKGTGAASEAAQQAGIAAAVKTAGTLTGIIIAVAAVNVAIFRGTLSHLPPLRSLIYAVWLVPLGELVLLATGQVFYRLRFRRAPWKYRLLIIQVTTTGREQLRVNEVIASIRSYRLRLPYQVWVVTEPGQGDSYPQADRVIMVPKDFTVRSERKARALEYSRQVRSLIGLDTADVKILYNDDDVLPTKGYISTAFAADYDVCEGVTAPRTQYSTWPLGHIITSHADDVRARQCLIYCSVFQGVLGKPVYVHGEGLTVTGEAERKVTWDYPVFASEDLTFGQQAAKMGLRWGWFHEHVELTSPWTLKDFFTQRKRWVWGDIHGITHRDVLPGTRALAVTLKYIIDSTILLFSAVGVLMRLTGGLPPSTTVYSVSKLALLTWLAVFFGVGWLGASGSVDGRNDDSRLLNALMAVVLSPLSYLITAAGLVWPLIVGNPRTFEVIKKTRSRG